MRTKTIWGSILMAAAASAGDEAPAAGAVFWVERDGSSAILMRDVPDGKPVWMADLVRQAWTFRPTPSGNGLGWDQQGIFEIARDGRVVRELSADHVAGGEFSAILSVDCLPGGNLLVFGRTRGKPGSAVVEIDREGKSVRTAGTVIPAMTVRAAGADTILWIHENRIIETDWSGKEIAAIALEKGSRCQDAVRLPTGNFLVTADTIAVERAKGKMGKAGKIGIAAEVAPDGTIVWQGMHECPRGIQAIPGGNALVGAG